MTTDEIFMRRCVVLAGKALGKTYPNPLVGAVIVHKGRIIGEGYHHKAGEPHAEIDAINSVADPSLLPESEIYVSLEPCSHYGRTPPCAIKLAEIGFKRVIIGSGDPNEKVNGNGIKILEAAGIPVSTNVLFEECRKLNRRFFTFQEKKRPYLTLKWAQSGDGFIDNNFKTAKISNALVSQVVHKIRSEEHAILVGTATALNDNPELSTRLVSGRNPVKILIDFDLKIPAGFKIYNNSAEVLVFNSIKNSQENHLNFIKINRENSLNQILTELYRRGIQSVLVEGGSRTLQRFISQNLWDEAVVIRNEELLFGNGTAAPEFNFEPFRTETWRNNTVSFYRNA